MYEPMDEAAECYSAEINAGGQRRERKILGMVNEPPRQVPVRHAVDVLVVGGGPAGTAAAIAAGRLGAKVILAERYNHLGGLSTGGLVIWIDRMTDWDGRLLIAGLGRELLDRLPKDAVLGPAESLWGSRAAEHVATWKPRISAFHGIVTHSPMVDPEALKAVSLQAVREAGVKLLFHVWASSAIVQDGRLNGVVFESKQGRFAVTAKVVIDTTGDGDIFADAGETSASDIEPNNMHHCMNTSWLLGGVNNETWLAFQSTAEFSDFTSRARRELGLYEVAMATWRNDVAVFMGPRWSGYSGLDVDDLTEVELRSRDKMMQMLSWYRANAPGFKDAWILLTAPQIGVRQTRRLLGQGIMIREDWRKGVVHDDEIAISPSLGPKFDPVSVPYRSLLPRGTSGLLVAGRHISTDASSQTFMREIPQCWLTGHAAGVAAGLAANTGVSPSEMPVRDIQKALLHQGAHLRVFETAS
ncbi:FAD-dependent oxidoreductase [Bradyrhizobium diazoefficiens]|uniref:FAD-dependent oxidoreductase n=1 Tax=Bradyrhizobium diazoefficiens TaxID=1355477 RepID=UPI00190A3076|nr:FAD-dependent oxidoreductase [Bradyrhizobium diazoefficiens]QQO35594.1 FAD-dependent oxidoreductase [Bradyrhizobium diazoefficiens]